MLSYSSSSFIHQLSQLKLAKEITNKKRGNMKISVAVYLIVLITLSSSFLRSTEAAGSFCDIKCNSRCQKAGIKRRCVKYCTICCRKCGCVPSGTYGNKSECPCYRDMLNSKGKSKCP